MKYRKRNRGFTLMETLIVVVLIAVLAVLAIVGVNKYLRNLRQLELDSVAEEIFVAAQNNLTMVYGQSYLGRSDGFGTEESEGAGIYYLVGGKGTPAGTLLDDIIPYGSVVEGAKSDGTYIIRYHKTAGTVLDVFYSEPDGRYGHALTSSDYSALTDPALYYDSEETSHKKERRKYGSDESVIGYYGGAEAEVISEDEILYVPILKVVNAETLYANIELHTEEDTEVTLELVVKGLTSGATEKITILDNGVLSGSNGFIKADVKNTGELYTVTLDDVTFNSSAKNHFADLFPTLTPGEDIEIQAVASVGGQKTESAVVSTNSLFASVDGGNKANISNIRHLENLSHEISNLSSAINSAVQNSDISLNDYMSAVGSSFEIATCGSTAYVSKEGTFRPIYTSGAFTYDGADHILSDFVIETAESNGEGSDAGVFGKLKAGSTVKNLVLVDFNVKSNGGCAGSVAGCADSSTISGVLVYNNKSAHTSEEESEFRIAAAGSMPAGGLIGKTYNSTVNACGAAVYVKSQSGYAGGLIGQTSGGGTVKNSYAGGHTRNAVYKKTTDGVARVNVYGGNAGGLIGLAEGTGVSYCYTTCSTTGTVSAAGLIDTMNGGSVSNCYAVGRVVSRSEVTGDTSISGDVDVLVHSVSGSPSFSGKILYLTGVSQNAGDSIVTGSLGVSGKDETATYFILPEASRVPAYIYDDTLLTQYKGSFYFPTIEQMYANFSGGSIPAAEKKAGITDKHYGDWQIPGLEVLEFEVENEDALRIKATPGDKTSYFTFTITGKTSGVTRAFVVSITDGVPSITKTGYVKDDISYVWSTPKAGDNLPLVTGSKETGIYITLDDITKSHQHFYELFCSDKANNLIPGENVDIRGCKNESSWSEVKNLEPVTVNSLFEDGSDLATNTALIYNVRHLQNLDPLISKLSGNIKKAKIAKNAKRGTGTWNGISWSTYYNTIYKYDGSDTVSAFLCIYNPNLQSFDGDLYSISGFDLREVNPSFINGNGMHNSGLFRYIDYPFELKNVMLSGFSVSATDKVGTAIAEIAGGTVTISKVTAESADSTVSSTGNAAGGLVGYVDGNVNLTIQDCASSMKVKSSASGSSGISGGLVGYIKSSSASVTITRSYVGGHTVSGNYQMSSAADCNIYGSGVAGGLVGQIDRGTLKINYSFSTASVGAAGNNGAKSGGIIGCINNTNNVELGAVYAFAPVWNITRKTDTGVDGIQTSGESGAFVGNVSSSTVKITSGLQNYYFPEVYGTTDEISAVGRSSGTAGALATSIKNESFYSSVTSPIAAKHNGSLLALKTHNYDSTLNGYEYPFAVWNACEYRSENNNPGSAGQSNHFYGDWLPIKDDYPTVNDAVTDTRLGITTVSLYKALGSVSSSTLFEDEKLNKQVVYKDEAGTVILPEATEINGYRFKGWVYADSSEAADTAATSLFLRPEKTGSDLSIYALYTTDTPVFAVSFYDVNPETGAVEGQIGLTKYVESHKSAVSLIPTVAKGGYTFKGWYTAPTGGTLISTSGDSVPKFSTVTAEIKAYARYEKSEYYNVTVEFMYEDSLGHLSMFGQEAYTFQVPKGESFGNKVVMPDLASRGVKLNRVTDASGKTVSGLDTATRTITLTASGETTYTAIYKAAVASNEVNYNIIYVYHDTNGSSMVYKAGSTYQETVTYKSITGQMTAATAPIKKGFNSRPVTNKEVKKTPITQVYVHYDRATHPILYNVNAGFSLSPDHLKYGEDVIGYLNTAKTNAEKARNAMYSGSSYVLSGWTVKNADTNEAYMSVLYNGATPTVTYYNGADGKMPDFPLVATASWTGTATYRIFYWLQEADVPDENDAFNKANYKVYVDSEDTKNFGTGIGTGVIGTVTNVTSSGKSFKHFHPSTVNGIEQQVIAADGSTVVNVYYDRDIYHVYFVKDRSKNPDILTTTTSYDKVAPAGGWKTDTGIAQGPVKQPDTVLDPYENNKGEFLSFRYAGYYYKNGFVFKNKGIAGAVVIVPYYKYEYTDDISPEYLDMMKIGGEGFYDIQLTIVTRYYGTQKADYYYVNGRLYKRKNDTLKNIGGVNYYEYERTTVDDMSSFISGGNGYYNKGAETTTYSNRYNDLTITARYEQDVHMLWPSHRDPATASTTNALWLVNTTGNVSQAFISEMPGKDTYFYFRAPQGVYDYYTNVYLENIGGEYAQSTDYSYSFMWSSGLSSTVEDYPMIKGYALIPYNSTDRGSFNTYVQYTLERDQTVYVNQSATNSSTTRIGSSSRNMSVYYSRNTYKIIYMKDNGDGNWTEWKMVSFKYGAPISLTAEVPTRSGFTFAGWYDNPFSGGSPYNATSKTMPANDIILYAKWENPTVSVTFNLNKPSGAAGTPKFGDNTTTAKIKVMELAGRIEDQSDVFQVTGSGETYSADYTSAYTPTLKDYTFKGWYLDAACSEEKVFYPSEEITANTNVYAKWQYDYINVRVKYLYVETNDNGDIIVSESLAADKVEKVKIGSSYTAAAIIDQTKLTPPAASKVYYPDRVEDTIRVTEDEQNPEIVFYYRAFDKDIWSYDVEYYLRYKDVSGTQSIEVLYSKNTLQADYTSQMVAFSMPAGLQNYRLASDSVVNVTRFDSSKVVKFYLEPDTSALTVGGASYIYDGTKHTDDGIKMGSNAFTTDTFTAPSGIQFITEYTYPDGDPVDFGTYGVQASVKVKDTSKTVTIWNGSGKLQVDKRKVVLESDSGSWTYDGNIHKLDAQANVKKSAKVENDGFVSGEGATYTFSADSFRRDRGTSLNAFEYTLNSNTKESNYVISKVYGVLKVQ